MRTSAAARRALRKRPSESAGNRNLREPSSRMVVTLSRVGLGGDVACIGYFGGGAAEASTMGSPSWWWLIT